MARQLVRRQRPRLVVHRSRGRCPVTRGGTSRLARAARADYARATLNTRVVLADPKASPMDRYRAAAQAEPELEAEL